MEKWEYNILILPFHTSRARQILTVYGLKGWEVVSIEKGTAYLKRPFMSKEEKPRETVNQCASCKFFQETEKVSDGVSVGNCLKHQWNTKSNESCQYWELNNAGPGS